MCACRYTYMDSYDECIICFEELKTSNKYCLEPCQHEFCKDCVIKLKANKHKLRCPLCRSLVEDAKTVST